MNVDLACVACTTIYPATEKRHQCDCGGLLEVRMDVANVGVSRDEFCNRQAASGVWRFRELVHPLAEKIVSRGEGNTFLYDSTSVSAFTGVRTLLKHEGENPTGSFKDRGMTAGVTEAVRQGAKTVVCASTGNTSASLASYAAIAGLKCMVLMPEGKIAFGKLSQALAYGAKAVQVKGNFDEALALVRQLAERRNYYVLNSVNPWRLEGQKTIIFEALMQLSFKVPDWVVVPAGNAGNTSAFGKALVEARQMGWIDRLPRLAAIQAEGANPLYQTWSQQSSHLMEVQNPETIASAIRIGRPVNWQKALKYLKATEGVVEQVSEQEIMDAKAAVDGAGIGCEPASAACVAGAKKLVDAGVISRGETVLGVLTGHVLKDPDATVNYHLSKLPGILPNRANPPVQVDATLESLEAALN